MKGTVFSIQEFTVHDGPGCRVTVFLKGCPLHCFWCHNPEGIRPEPQLLCKTARCTHCGRCLRGCAHEDCRPFGRCLHACPQGLLTVSGQIWSADALADRLNGYGDMLDGGGVTFSGGEPLMQMDFLEEVCCRLRLHKAVQTSGYAPEEVFRRMLGTVDYILFDIKLADRRLHRKYTGADNDLILHNYRLLLDSGKPHVVRVPLIPAVTDTRENLAAIAALTRHSHVELMRYNPCAGAKYDMLGLPPPPEPGPPGPVELGLFASAALV